MEPETFRAMVHPFDVLLEKNPDADRNVMVCPHLGGYRSQVNEGDPIWRQLARRPDIREMPSFIMRPDALRWSAMI